MSGVGGGCRSHRYRAGPFVEFPSSLSGAATVQVTRPRGARLRLSMPSRGVQVVELVAVPERGFRLATGSELSEGVVTLPMHDHLAVSAVG